MKMITIVPAQDSEAHSPLHTQIALHSLVFSKKRHHLCQYFYYDTVIQGKYTVRGSLDCISILASKVSCSVLGVAEASRF